MSLFVINRYEGEKKETENEKNQLSELLKRIEERKQERAAKNNNEIKKNNSQNPQELNHKKKKKKTKNFNEAYIENIKLNENSIINDNEQKRENLDQDHKKKKKKRKNIHNEENYEKNDKTLYAENTYDQDSILGEKTRHKSYEVKRILPEWLTNPKIISVDLDSGPSLEELHSILDLKLIEVLRTNDRQQKWWLRDTCVSAPTGSGKTLAYVLPIIQILQSRLVPKVRCLVVVPVQELATQVYKVFVTYTSHTNLKVGLLSGASIFHEEQKNILKETTRGEYISIVDIIIATPGRLIDHILKTPGFSLNDLQFLIIDEADKAADWLEYLPDPHYRRPRLTLFNLHSCEVPAQKLLFSATLSQDPEKLNRLGLFQPILFTSVLVTDKDDDINLDKEIGYRNFIGRYTSPKELKEQAIECATEYKPAALYHIIINNDVIPKTLIFTNSGETTHRLTILLQSLLSEKNIIIGELSAQLVSKEREKILNKFINGKIQILICSDALARGVDIPDVQLVVSYDLPKHINGYIHRAGRTGRAGKSGTAISILTPKQVGIFKHMLNNAHKVIPNIDKLDLSSIINEIDYSNHIDKLRHVLEIEKQNNLERIKTVKRIHLISSK
ncbi:ATP-dependent RNA helicase [Apis cerana cerana]|uniref:ATP-dependent RNA helicase n=1 Tax=Apis cerana cerana TaxID=94128 RepID=A0A2A3E8B0_APICC|nr:ATP-dependent RNA helicase [Apis cerana cerana]